VSTLFVSVDDNRRLIDSQECRVGLHASPDPTSPLKLCIAGETWALHGFDYRGRQTNIGGKVVSKGLRNQTSSWQTSSPNPATSDYVC
jgi:hypothetical protein